MPAASRRKLEAGRSFGCAEMAPCVLPLMLAVSALSLQLGQHLLQLPVSHWAMQGRTDPWLVITCLDSSLPADFLTVLLVHLLTW